MSNGIIAPKTYSIESVKHRLMQPALTSHFHCQFNPPSKVQEQFQFNELISDQWSEDLLITCSEASLPGSSLATHDLNNDFTGVSQKHAYRRLYDDRADFTFYVNNQYSQIKVFEVWLRYIAGEQISQDRNSPNLQQYYRAQYPKSYKANVTITKFERDTLSLKATKRSKSMTYTFVNAFPVSINSMPVSFDTSQLLKCTVSFAYDRYFSDIKGIKISQSTSPQTPEQIATANANALTSVPFKDSIFTDPNLKFNIAPSEFGISAGTLTNSPMEGEELLNARVRRVEEGLPYVGRNRSPMARWSGI